jgi:hypothetical protein
MPALAVAVDKLFSRSVKLSFMVWKILRILPKPLLLLLWFFVLVAKA